MWGAWHGGQHSAGELASDQNWRVTGHLQGKLEACLLLRVPQNREASKKGEGGGAGKKKERKEKMKGGKRQENPNSHPGRDLKGQQQLSAPPSRTPKTSLLSSPHWYLSAAQTHTQEALLRVHSSLCLCLPWGVQRAGEHMGLTGATSHLRKVLHPHKAQHHPTRASKPGYLFESGQSQWAPSHTGPQDPNVLCCHTMLC